MSDATICSILLRLMRIRDGDPTEGRNWPQQLAANCGRDSSLRRNQGDMAARSAEGGALDLQLRPLDHRLRRRFPSPRSATGRFSTHRSPTTPTRTQDALLIFHRHRDSPAIVAVIDTGDLQPSTEAEPQAPVRAELRRGGKVGD